MRRSSFIIATVVTAIACSRPGPATAAQPEAARSSVGLGECRRNGGSSENSRQSHDGRLIRWRAYWSGDGCRIEINATGDLRFNSDFTDILSVDRGGFVEVSEVQGNTLRRMTLRMNGARLERTWFVNGHEQAWDADAQRWLADLLVELDRNSAIGIDYRFPKLFAQGGAKAVIDEAEKMPSDYAQSIYLRRLIDSTRLTDAEYTRIVSVAARDVDSDYEMSRILRAVADHSPLENAEMRQSYLRAVDRMSSDYERSRVLQTILAKAPASHEVAAAAIHAAASMKSDYERSRVLLTAIENRSLGTADVVPILETVAKSTSDYEKARVMLAVAGRWTLEGDARKAYLRAADSIRSDYENRRVLTALLR